MKCGARVALGVAGGYFLGRTKKMKLALMLAGMAAGRQAGGPGALLGQGKNLLNASPELSRLTDEVRGRLLDAGKSAALAVATRQVEALTDRVTGRVESSLGNISERGRGSRNSSPAAGEDDDTERAPVEDEVAEDYDEEPANDYSEEEASESESEEEPQSDSDESRSTAPARKTRRTAPSTAKTGTRTAARRTTAGAASGRRTAEKAAGRPARARRRNDNG
jgi:hypothetical protein